MYERISFLLKRTFVATIIVFFTCQAGVANSSAPGYQWALNDPQSAAAHMACAEWYKNRNDYQGAVLLYTKAINLDSTLTMAYVLRGEAYARTGNVDKGIADETKAIERDVNLADAYYYRGCMYNYKQQFKLALKDLDKAIELKPGYAEAYARRGDVKVGLSRYDEALRDGEHAVALDSGNASGYYVGGTVYFLRAQHEQAIAWLSKAVGADPKFAPAYFSLGVTLEAVKRAPDAVTAYQKFLQYAPMGDAGIELARKRVQALGGKEELYVSAEPMDVVAFFPKADQVHRLNTGRKICTGKVDGREIDIMMSDFPGWYIGTFTNHPSQKEWVALFDRNGDGSFDYMMWPVGFGGLKLPNVSQGEQLVYMFSGIYFRHWADDNGDGKIDAVVMGSSDSGASAPFFERWLLIRSIALGENLEAWYFQDAIASPTSWPAKTEKGIRYKSDWGEEKEFDKTNFDGLSGMLEWFNNTWKNKK